MSAPRRWSRTGAILCLVYLAATATCLLFALDGADPKGRFVLLQLPIGLQASLADAIGLRPLMHGMSWCGAYLVFVPSTLAVLYASGALLGRIASGRLWKAR